MSNVVKYVKNLATSTSQTGLNGETPYLNLDDSSTSINRTSTPDQRSTIHIEGVTQSYSTTDNNNNNEVDGQNSQVYTLDEAIDHMGFGLFQVKLSLLTGLAWMADAMEMMILSILAPALHCDWLLNEWQKALITTVVFCGMMMSGMVWGKLCDTYGRKAVNY
jgi:hypothetical protein